MLAYDAIQDASYRAAAKAAREGRYPFVVEEQDRQRWLEVLDRGQVPKLPLPYLGYFDSPDWEEQETYLVDSSGVGQDDEPALTARQFVRKIEPGFGYAIKEVGQFQVVVARYSRVRNEETPPDTWLTADRD